MSVPANFSIVTLGVSDLERSARFYRRLGWEQRGDLAQDITWFRTSGSWVGLFPHVDLAADVGLPADPPPAFLGITLAINVTDEAAVNAALEAAAEAGPAGEARRPSRVGWLLRLLR